MRIYKVIVFALFFFNTLAQQPNEECITQVSDNILELEHENKELYNYYIDEYFEKLNNKSSTAITQIPAKLHIVTDGGGNTSVSINEILNELDEANTHLAASFLEIYICDEINYIADSNLYEFDSTDDQGLLYSNNQSNILNLYFVDEIAFGDGYACGYTYFGGSTNQYYDVIVMDNQCIGAEYNTLVHEFGHHFNLYHTHGDGTPHEYVNGTNCNVAGDFLCDTPADPQLSSSTVSNVNCLYSGNEVDELGFPYEPDPTNFMTYAPQVCRDNFSPMGNARMYAAFHIYRNYYECPSFNVGILSEVSPPDCDDNLVVNFYDNSVAAESWQWDVDGDDIIDYTDQNPTHNYTPGVYDVALTITNGSETLTKVFPQYINFTSNIYETSKVNLKVFIIDLNENTWELTDDNGTVLYEGGPYDQTGEHNHEFDISQSECYTFTIYDSAGNGLDNYFWTIGSEFYELTTEEGVLIHTNTDFGYEESTMISTQYLSLNNILNNSLTLFPNPADNFIQIQYDYLMPDNYSIIDINGRLIESRIIINENDLLIDVRDFEKGLYFIILESSKGINSLKFVIE